MSEYSMELEKIKLNADDIVKSLREKKKLSLLKEAFFLSWFYNSIVSWHSFLLIYKAAPSVLCVRIIVRIRLIIALWNFIRSAMRMLYLSLLISIAINSIPLRDIKRVSTKSTPIIKSFVTFYTSNYRLKPKAKKSIFFSYAASEQSWTNWAKECWSVCILKMSIDGGVSISVRDLWFV